MRQLFLRFFIGVLLTLAIAGMIQQYLVQSRTDARTNRTIETIVQGGARHVRGELDGATPAERDDHLARLSAQYHSQARIFSLDDFSVRSQKVFPEDTLERFAGGEEVVASVHGHQLYFATPLQNGKEVLLFGGIPLLESPTRMAEMTGLAGVLIAAALVIFLLLRPVANQLQALEQTASQIAGGDLSARVDERKLRSTAKLGHALNDMAERVELLLVTQRELLQAVSHELRTPLSRIRFATALSRNAKSDEEREQWMDSIDVANREVDDLVEELLSFVRLETSLPTLNRQTIELLPFVNELTSGRPMEFPATAIVIGSELSKGNITLSADRPQLARCLGNVIRNSIRFAASRVVINSAETRDGIRIDVEDDGPGIPEADRTRIFEPFFRCDESESGAGLGLALVQRIVARHGGSVCAVQSALGGAHIRINWPEAEARPPAATDQTREGIDLVHSGRPTFS